MQQNGATRGEGEDVALAPTVGRWVSLAQNRETTKGCKFEEIGPVNVDGNGAGSRSLRGAKQEGVLISG